MIQELIERKEIIIEDYLIRIPLRTLDYIRTLNEKTFLIIDFLRLLQEYLYLTEYKDCIITPLFNGGLTPNLEFLIALIPKKLDENGALEWYSNHIKERLNQLW